MATQEITEESTIPPKHIDGQINPLYVVFLEEKLEHVYNTLVILKQMLKDETLDRQSLYGAALTGIQRII